jgi:His/Glu/Gln/Arg/opine family amino acid ABC transporter permease subunit
MTDLIASHGPLIVAGFAGTLRVVAIGFCAGALAGAALGAIACGPVGWARVIVRGYVEVIRNTPFLVQASLIFALFGVAGIRIAPMTLGIAAVALYTAAYMSEVVRGAYRSLPAGQTDAARALGLGRVARLRKVIAPQLLPAVIPGAANLAATVTKESAFLAALSVAELTFAGQVAISQTFRVFEIWAIVGALYLVLILALLGVAARLERGLAWARVADQQR